MLTNLATYGIHMHPNLPLSDKKQNQSYKVKVIFYRFKKKFFFLNEI